MNEQLVLKGGWPHLVTGKGEGYITLLRLIDPRALDMGHVQTIVSENDSLTPISDFESVNAQ